jgi:hypothetical protein
MSTIVTRAGKGSALTHNEVDANFVNLNNDKIEAAQSVTLTNKTISGSTNTLSNIGNSSLTNSSVTIGSTSVSLGSTAATVAGLTLTSPTISSITNTGTLTLPTSTDTLVGRNTTDTLTNKTLTSPTVNTATISGGTINNSAIGGTTPNSGAFTTLSATGVTTVQAGTAAAPAITTSGDTNTGIFFPAADTIAFSEGGVESMRIDSSGNVGVGTSSPVNKLNVVSSVGQVDNDGLIKAEYTGSTSTVNASVTAKNYGGTSQFMQWELNGLRIGSRITTNGGSGAVVFTTGNDTERVRITSGGDVGIGNSSPAYKLDVTGNARFTTGAHIPNNNWLFCSNTSGTFRDSFGYFTDNNLYITAWDGAMIFRSGGATERGRFASGGQLTLANQPAFRARLSTSGDITFTINTKLPFNAIVFDRNSNYSTANSRFTAPVTGVYEIFAAVYGTSSGGASTMGLRLYRNGSDIGNTVSDINIGNSGGQIGISTIALQQLVQLTAGDYVEIFCTAYNGSTFRIFTGTSTFAGYLLG